MEEQKTFMVEDAQLIFRNFAGKESAFNAKGRRTFGVLLEPEVAKQMLRDGWNVKYLKAEDGAEEDVEGAPWIPAFARFDIRPPRIVVITDTARTTLNENSVETLDYADIRKVDLICNGYFWEVGEKSGLKAYLKSMFVTIEEDALERKYAIQGENE